MLPCNTRSLYASSVDAEDRDRYARLVRLLPDSHYHAERAPQRFLGSGAASEMIETHTLAVGWEQRIEPPAKGGQRRIFYMDHFARMTQLADPRSLAKDNEVDEQTSADALREFMLICSGLLPDQAVTSADYRTALNRALRSTLGSLLTPDNIVPVTLRDRRLQLQQHIQYALLERMFGRGAPAGKSLAHAQEVFLQDNPNPSVPTIEKGILDSLLKHANQSDPMAIYTSGRRAACRAQGYAHPTRIRATKPATTRASAGVAMRAALLAYDAPCTATCTYILPSTCALSQGLLVSACSG